VCWILADLLPGHRRHVDAEHAEAHACTRRRHRDQDERSALDERS